MTFDEYTEKTPDEVFRALYHSVRRLEKAGIHVAVWDDGSCRLVAAEQINVAWGEGAKVFSPQEMCDYVLMSPEGRYHMRQLKGLE